MASRRTSSQSRNAMELGRPECLPHHGVLALGRQECLPHYSWAVAAAALMLAVTGCASKQASHNQKINHWLSGADTDVPAAVYRVQPPDVIAVSAPKIKEIDGQTRVVGPDGKVVFNLVGAMDVVDKTTDQIAADMAGVLRRYYGRESLDVVVRVTEYRSRFIYVFGQVRQPGRVPYTGRDSLLKVIATTGLNEDAWPERVVVVRPHDDPNTKQKVTVDVAAMYEKGDVSRNVLLEDGDVVYVPPTPLAELNVTFNKLLAPIRPASVLASIARGGL